MKTSQRASRSHLGGILLLLVLGGCQYADKHRAINLLGDMDDGAQLVAGARPQISAPIKNSPSARIIGDTVDKVIQTEAVRKASENLINEIDPILE